MRTTRETGFTLIELLITIGLIGIIAAIASPNFMKYRQNADLRSAAQSAVSHVMEYRHRSIAQGIRHCISYEPDNNRYIIEEGTSSGSPYTTLITCHPDDFGDGITITSAVFGAGQALFFQTRGTATAGHVVLANSRGSTATITVNIAGRTNVVFVMQ